MKTLVLGWAVLSLAHAAEAQWRYVRELAVQNPGMQAKDAVIEVQLKADFGYAKAAAGGADIRFSASNGNGSEAKLPYWIEQWNVGGISRIWVKAPTLPALGSKVYLFYGNGAAPAASSGAETFLFFDDFEDGSFAGKWTNVSIASVVEKGGMLQLLEADGQEGVLTSSFTVTGAMIVRALYQRGGGDGHWVRSGIGGWNHWFCYGDHTDSAGSGTNYVMMYDSASIAKITANPLKKVVNTVITDKWRRVAFWHDGARLAGTQDSSLVDWTAANASSKLALRTLDNDNTDNYAFISVSGLLNPAPTVAVGAETDANSVGVLSRRPETAAQGPLPQYTLSDGRLAPSKTAMPRFRNIPAAHRR